MRIGSITPVYPPYPGGIGVVAQREARALRERGVSVDIFVPTPRDGCVSEDSVIPLAPLWHNGHAAIVPSLFWRLRGVDVIYLHYPFYGAEIFALLASWIWSKPLIVRYHMRVRVHGWRNVIFYVHRLLLEPLILATARVVLVSSRDYAQSIGLPDRRLREIPFGVDTSQFRSDDRKTGEEIRFLFVGGMDRPHYFKGVPDLLKACATLPDCGWRLTLVGDGELRHSFEELAKTYGIDHRVTLVGKLPHDELVAAFASADVHVLPSINTSEAFGLVTLEAAASGCASIVSDLPGVRTLVQDGVTGFLAKPGHIGSLSSALMHCLQHIDQVREMGRAARDRVAAMYDEQYVMDELFKEIML